MVRRGQDAITYIKLSQLIMSTNFLKEVEAPPHVPVLCYLFKPFLAERVVLSGTFYWKKEHGTENVDLIAKTESLHVN